ncbi:PTS transporter subunit EIIC [Desemzia sp. RIT804]|uniref:PTS transporter subunit EIIC n=1 Tax=Desemzia sp. RIT 804 TaxID=2810209 RepID=UPI0019505C2D|nr:PTS transporter subunit EIIC [Desemzia sp. RIT 804]MBM6615345.1 PTS transporter subunit EIIC [Desemzia sp. RIT 804]
MNTFLQKLGRSLLLPIVAMPIAGIIFRLTAPDLLDIPLFQAAGAIITRMDELIAIGIAIGLSKGKSKGIPALVGYLAIVILKEAFAIVAPEQSMNVFGGILAGLVAAAVFNRFKDTKLPDMLAFFSGEKFPITMIIAVMLPIAWVATMVWPFAQNGIDTFAQTLMGLGAVGIFLFGFFNRALIPIGLHHVLNTYIYFGMGSYTTASGEVVHGEITRFLNGDPTAGYFIGGFFLVMMFGVPAIALAIYRAAKYDKDQTKTLMTSGAGTSFLTGITEPIEFTFLFTSPLLYLIHAVYTGLAGAILYLFEVRLGFSWGASLIDYLANFGIASKPLWIIPIGIVFFLMYYFTFYFVIKYKQVPIIGQIAPDQVSEEATEEEKSYKLSHSNHAYMAKKVLEFLGGETNIENVDNCITRLRIDVLDSSIVNKEKILQTGAKGVLMKGNHVQVVIGPEVTTVRTELDKIM